MKKLCVFFAQILLAISISHSVLAKKSNIRYCRAFNGYFIGAETGVMLARIKRRFDLQSSAGEGVPTYPYSLVVNQNAPALGFEMGYGKPIKNNNYIGILFNALYHLGDEAGTMANTGISGPNETYTPEVFLRMDYTANLAVTPGYFINKNSLVYLMFGGAYAHVTLKEKYHYLSQTTNIAMSHDVKPAKDILGFIVGLGAKYHITKCFNLFAEYGYTIYPRFTLRRYTVPANSDNLKLSKRYNHLRMQSIMIGMDSYFDVA